MAHLYISAAHKSSGKTVVATGICAALAGRGLAVQPFKKGPDYIDPMWLGAAAGRPCRNLDFHTMGEDEILAAFAGHGADADVSVIEGNKGLHDGLDPEGADSNAALAALLGAPVVLVIDVRGITRGIAPLLLGTRDFDPSARIAGVILNRLGGDRHEAKLRAAIERYTDIEVLGAIRRSPSMEIAERHLGLVPGVELGGAEARIDAIARAVAGQVDLDRLLAVAAEAGPPPRPSPLPSPSPPRPAAVSGDVRIGIARDSAFCFYYPDDLEALEEAGAELVPFDTMSQPRLPDIDGLFIGGGFPETHLEALAANVSLRRHVRDAIEGGLPAYAECGGLLYLARTVTWRGTTREMAGVVAADAVFHDAPVAKGYARLRETGRGPWPMADADGRPGEAPAHEFHYSSLENLEGSPVFAYEIVRGKGIDGFHDGIVQGNLLAGYAHLRDVGANRWARRFVEFVRAHAASS